jgi:tetratricopeptide (TPR) repeat protein
MPSAKTIEDSASATLEWLDEALRRSPSDVADEATAEERFADLVASQLLRLIPAELRRRSTWSGYGGTAVARRLLEAFYGDESWNAWEPIAALSVADAAWAIAKTSARRTPALLFRALVSRAAVLALLDRFDEAFASLDQAEEYAADTKLRRLHLAVAAHHRAAVCYHADAWTDAMSLIQQARGGYEACGDATRLRYLRTLEAAAWKLAGKSDRSRQIAEASLEEAIRSGDETVIMIETSNIGIYCVDTGDAPAARWYLGRALSMTQARGWKIRTAELLSQLGTLEIRERGIDGIAISEKACLALDQLGMDGDWAEARLEIAEELLKIDPDTDVRSLCRQAYARALSCGRLALVGRALELMDGRQPLPSSG